MRHTILGWGLALAIVFVVLATGAVAEDEEKVLVLNSPPFGNTAFMTISGDIGLTDEGELYLSAGEGMQISVSSSDKTTPDLAFDGKREGNDNDWLNLVFGPNFCAGKLLAGDNVIPKDKGTSREGNEIAPGVMQIVLTTRERGFILVGNEQLEVRIPTEIMDSDHPHGTGTYYIWLEENEAEEVVPEVDTSEVVPDDWSPPYPYDDGCPVFFVHTIGRIEDGILRSTLFLKPLWIESRDPVGWFALEKWPAVGVPSSPDYQPGLIATSADEYVDGYYGSLHADTPRTLFVYLAPAKNGESGAMWSPGITKKDLTSAGIFFELNRGSDPDNSEHWFAVSWKDGGWVWEIWPDA